MLRSVVGSITFVEGQSVNPGSARANGRYGYVIGLTLEPVNPKQEQTI